MNIPMASEGAFVEAPPPSKAFKRFVRVFLGRKLVIFGVIVIALFIIAALFAPWLSPHNPNKPNIIEMMQNPSLKHPLGTDPLGRDTLSRIIYGSRVSLVVGLVAVGFAAVIGMTLGLVAGYFGGLPSMVIMRLQDAIMAIPMILLALTIAALLGGGIQNVVIALGIALIPAYARLMCGQVLTVMENDYIMASNSIGTSHVQIMRKHVLPNCLPPLIVLITMQIGLAILSEASLSFLGIGINPPDAAWGSMVSEGYKYLLKRPMLSIAPGGAIMLVVFAFNMIGDGLRDALDPKLRGTL